MRNIIKIIIPKIMQYASASTIHHKILLQDKRRVAPQSPWWCNRKSGLIDDAQKMDLKKKEG
jgi:hypothetical protein